MDQPVGTRCKGGSKSYHDGVLGEADGHVRIGLEAGGPQLELVAQPFETVGHHGLTSSSDGTTGRHAETSLNVAATLVHRRPGRGGSARRLSNQIQ